MNCRLSITPFDEAHEYGMVARSHWAVNHLEHLRMAEVPMLEQLSTSQAGFEPRGLGSNVAPPAMTRYCPSISPNGR